jgi:hypothetical protein
MSVLLKLLRINTLSNDYRTALYSPNTYSIEVATLRVFF